MKMLEKILVATDFTSAARDALRTACAVAVNTVAVIQAFYLVNCRSLRHGVLSIGLFRNGWLWAGIAGVLALQAALTYLPVLNRIFRTAPIGLDEWLRIIGAGVAAFLLVEVQKRLTRSAAPAQKPAGHG